MPFSEQPHSFEEETANIVISERVSYTLQTVSLALVSLTHKECLVTVVVPSVTVLTTI